MQMNNKLIGNDISRDEEMIVPYALSRYQFIHGWVIKGNFKCYAVAIGYARIVTINDQYR